MMPCNSRDMGREKTGLSSPMEKSLSHQIPAMEFKV
jgi:hypothetical protein